MPRKKHLTLDEHRARHLELHRALDELIADAIRCKRDFWPDTATVNSLLQWSHKQTTDPDEPVFGV